MPRKKSTATIRVQQTKSAIGYNKSQREVLKGMGLRRMQQIVELEDSPSTRGMIFKVRHLVTVLDNDSAAARGNKEN